MKRFFLSIALILFFIPVLQAQGNKTVEFKSFIKDTDRSNNYLLTAPYSMAFDKDGNVYILDIREYTIFKFDVKGKYIASIGKKGKGPGEMQSPLGISIKGDNLFQVDATPKINTFNLKGEVISSRLKEFTALQSIKIFPTEFFIGGEYNADELFISLNKYDWQGKRTDVLDKISYLHYFNQKELSETRNLMMSSVETMMFCINPNGEILFAKTNKYEVSKFSDGKTKVIISEDRKAKKRLNIKGIEKKIRENAGFKFLSLTGDSYYFVNSLMTDTKGNIWFYTISEDRSGIVKYSPEGKFKSFYNIKPEFLEEAIFFMDKDYIYCIYISPEKIEIYRAEIPK